MKFPSLFKFNQKQLLLCLVITGLLSVIFIFSAVYAQIDYPFRSGIDQDESAPSISACSTSIKDCILWSFSIVFNVLIWLAGALAVIMFVWAGILYITKPDKSQDIHSRLYWGVIGVVVALISFGVVRVIEFELTKPVNNQSLINNYALFANRYLPIFKPVLAAENPNPLDKFSSSLRGVSPAGISGCGAKSIFTYIFKSDRSGKIEIQESIPNVPKGLLGRCVLGFLGTKLLPVIYTISLLWSVAVLIWLGLEYVQSHGDVKNLHQKFFWLIIGVIITVLAFSLVKAIEISLTLPPPR